MNSTSASAPASSSRSAISPVELKYGLSLTATGTLTASLTRVRTSTCRCSTSRPEMSRVAGEVVDVQLDRGSAGILHRPGIVGPAAGRDAVEAADHRDVDGCGGALEQAQVAPRPGLFLSGGREVGERLREALGACVDELRVLGRLAAQLLLEERVEDDRADAGVGEPPNAVHGLRERGGRRDERVAQREAHVAGREIHQRSFRASAAKCCAPRVAISSYTSQRWSTASSASPCSRSASAGSVFARLR